MAELDWRGDYGFLQVQSEGVYNEQYFAKYVGYAMTTLGFNINQTRLELVNKFVGKDGLVVDIGIGCGQFVQSRWNTLGFDVNPAGIAWLKERKVFINPYRIKVPAMTFWDSFEHIEDPRDLLKHCMDWVFMSVPIFQDKEHVLRSKHYRPDEHWLYFTELGLLRYMREASFELVQRTDDETVLGREDILSFVFRRFRQ